MMLLLASLLVPLESSTRWYHLEYMGKPSNTVVFDAGALKVHVKKSASPLFYRLDGPLPVKAVSVSGHVSALPALPEDREEGWGAIDDFALRLGIISEGDRRFSWLERIFLPRWLNKLADLAGDSGLGSIRFLTLAQRAPEGALRRHPKFEFLEEEVARRMTVPGDFSFSRPLPEVRMVRALWIQADGDDSRSSFTTRLDRIELSTEPAPSTAPEGFAKKPER